MDRDHNTGKPAWPAALLLAVCLAGFLASCTGKEGKAGGPGKAARPDSAGQPPAGGPARPGPAGSGPPPEAALKMQPVAVPGSVAEAPQEPPPGDGAAPDPLPPPKEGPAESVLPLTMLSARAFVLAAPGGPILPEDSMIGPLQDWRSQKDGEAWGIEGRRLLPR